MAKRACAGIDRRVVYVLDPAAGAGILAAAALEELLSKGVGLSQIVITLFESDGRFLDSLERLASRMRRAGTRAGVQVKVSIRIDDFLLSEFTFDRPAFDLIIANPPYFKLRKSDPRSTRHSYAVHGQPNIYGLFMAACASLLTKGGRWCFITPRSWTNGTYFALARRHMLTHLRIDAIHTFESRREHFTDDEVLQEAMITWATSHSIPSNSITLSTSAGTRDLAAAPLRSLPICDVIAADQQSVISLPSPHQIAAPEGFLSTLETFGIRVSTGPVVAFRASAYITENAGRWTVPLLWMQHIQPMHLSWPISKKREHIAASAATAWMLVPNANMVIMRRFSPKEDNRRVIAAPYLAGSLSGEALGLENHTNYLYRPGGELSVDEAKGFAAFLNSSVVDRYLRMVAGSTQVNAADLRAMPCPSLDRIIQIGRSLPDDCSLQGADEAVHSVLQPNDSMVA
jgi:adenine-specific DNA-methyltransferase